MLKFLIIKKVFFALLFPLSSLAGEGSTYNFSWLDKDKEIHVLQNRKYRKKHNIFIHAGGGFTASGAFTKAWILQGEASFFFHEEFGIEGFYTLTNTEENDVTTFLKTNYRDLNPFKREAQNYVGGLLLWSPFYSKINTFNIIVYMDWIFGLGYGTINEKHIPLEENQYQEESHGGILWSIGAPFLLNRNIIPQV